MNPTSYHQDVSLTIACLLCHHLSPPGAESDQWLCEAAAMSMCAWNMCAWLNLCLEHVCLVNLCLEHVCLVKLCLKLEGLNKQKVWWWVTTSQLDMMTYWHSKSYRYMEHTDTSNTYTLKQISQEVCAVKLRWNGVVVIACCHHQFWPIPIHKCEILITYCLNHNALLHASG